jgi:hypothetical protein
VAVRLLADIGAGTDVARYTNAQIKEALAELVILRGLCASDPSKSYQVEQARHALAVLIGQQ